MVTIRLKGVNPVRCHRTGEMRYYAWRGKGAPRLKGAPGSPEFVQSYHDAYAARMMTDDGKVRALVTAYRLSDEWKGLAETTRRQRLRWLDRITGEFGALPVAAFDRADRMRRNIKRWRDTFKDTPRTADYGVQTLSALLTWAVDDGRLSTNACEGIKAIYKADRSGNIWTAADMTRFLATAPVGVGQAVELAAATGLRRGDLLRLSWSHVGENEIVIRTGKSGEKVEARVPIYGDLRALLTRIPKRSTTVLTNTKGRPWTANGFATAYNRARIDAGLAELDLTFHDLRGTAATHFYRAGLDLRVIAEIMSWSEDSVEKIIRRYVGSDAATKAVIEQLDRAKRGT
jgi:integrase